MLALRENNRKWWILAALSLVIVMSNIDMTALNMALPAIGKEFKAGLSSLQWIVNAYIIAMGLFAVIGGKFGDVFGHRKILIIGISIFVFSSFLCAISSHENILIFWRALQGLGAGIAFPLLGIITYEIFPENQKGFAMGIFAGVAGITQSIGPTLGGAIVEYLSWHWIFFINIPIGILGILLLFLSCPKNLIAPTLTSIDYKGMTFLLLGLLSIMAAANEVQNWGFFSWWFCGSIFLGLLCLGVFIFLENKISFPLIDLKLFSNKAFLLIIFLRLIINYAFFVILFALTLCMQNILNFSPLKTGILMLFMTGIFGVMGPIAGKIIDNFGARKPMMIAFFLLTLSFLMFAFVNVGQSLFILILPLFLFGIAVGVIFPASNISVLRAVSEEKRGEANGIYFTVAVVGGSFGVAIGGNMLAMLSLWYLKSQILLENLTVSPDKFAILRKIANGSLSINSLYDSFLPDMVQKFLPIVQKSFLMSYSCVMLSCAVLCLLAVFLTLKMIGDKKI